MRRILLVLAALLSGGASCDKPVPQTRHHFRVMDTPIQVDITPQDAPDMLRIISLSEDRMHRLGELFDTTRRKSEISEVNRLAIKQRYLVSEDTFRLLRFANEYHVRTGGYFDITLLQLSRMYGFVDDPPPEEINQELARASATSIGMRHIRMFERPAGDGGLVEFRTPFVQLDLNGLIDGYMADLAILRLRNNEYGNLRVQVGNSARSLGIDEWGDYWSLEIPHPFSTNSVMGKVVMKDRLAASFSLKGSHTVTIGDQTISHIINPKNGVPATEVALSVVAGKVATLTDALATALIAAGMQEAPAILANFPDAHAMLIPDRQPMEIYMTPGFREYGRIKADLIKDLEIRTIEVPEPSEIEVKPPVDLPEFPPPKN